jgi:hypothetical protein
MWEWQNKFLKTFGTVNRAAAPTLSLGLLDETHVTLRKGDIIEEARRYAGLGFKFNIIDFDLMTCKIDDLTLKELAETLTSIAKHTTIVNLTTCLGRSVTEKDYRDSRVLLDNHITKRGWKVRRYPTSGPGKYKDRIQPVGYEHLVLQAA